MFIYRSCKRKIKPFISSICLSSHMANLSICIRFIMKFMHCQCHTWTSSCPNRTVQPSFWKVNTKMHQQVTGILTYTFRESHTFCFSRMRTPVWASFLFPVWFQSPACIPTWPDCPGWSPVPRWLAGQKCRCPLLDTDAVWPQSKILSYITALPKMDSAI